MFWLPIAGDISSCATSIPFPSGTLNIASRSDGFIVIAASDEMSIPLVSMKLGPGVLPEYAALPFANATLGGGELIVAVAEERSRNASDGEKASGLLCCDVDSFEPPERSVLLRIGRIHGGRGLVPCEPSGRGESRGICVTEGLSQRAMHKG